ACSRARTVIDRFRCYSVYPSCAIFLRYRSVLGTPSATAPMDRAEHSADVATGRYSTPVEPQHLPPGLPRVQRGPPTVEACRHLASAEPNPQPVIRNPLRLCPLDPIPAQGWQGRVHLVLHGRKQLRLDLALDPLVLRLALFDEWHGQVLEARIVAVPDVPVGVALPGRSAGRDLDAERTGARARSPRSDRRRRLPPRSSSLIVSHCRMESQNAHFIGNM